MECYEGIDRRRKNTDPFEITVCEMDTMEVLQALGCPVQLSPMLSEGSGVGSEVTHQLQSVGAIVFNVLHNGPLQHPLGNGYELSFLRVFLDPDKFQDVRMR